MKKLLRALFGSAWNFVCAVFIFAIGVLACIGVAYALIKVVAWLGLSVEVLSADELSSWFMK